jgi:hypothetical protein
LHADLGERIAHVIKLEGLDNGCYLFHVASCLNTETPRSAVPPNLTSYQPHRAKY